MLTCTLKMWISCMVCSGMVFHTKWKTPTAMWAFTGLWQHDPKNCSTACGETNPCSKFYNSWRTEAQMDCRLKVQRIFFTINILLRKKKKKKPLAPEIIHLQMSRLNFYFSRGFFFRQVWIWVVEKIWLQVIFQTLYLFP